MRTCLKSLCLMFVMLMMQQNLVALFNIHPQPDTWMEVGTVPLKYKYSIHPHKEIYEKGETVTFSFQVQWQDGRIKARNSRGQLLYQRLIVYCRLEKGEKFSKYHEETAAFHSIDTATSPWISSKNPYFENKITAEVLERTPVVRARVLVGVPEECLNEQDSLYHLDKRLYDEYTKITGTPSLGFCTTKYLKNLQDVPPRSPSDPPPPTGYPSFGSPKTGSIDGRDPVPPVHGVLSETETRIHMCMKHEKRKIVLDMTSDLVQTYLKHYSIELKRRPSCVCCTITGGRCLPCF